MPQETAHAPGGRGMMAGTEGSCNGICIWNHFYNTP